MLPHLYIAFCKLLYRCFLLLQLQVLIYQIVYDTGFKAGEAADYYERYLVTRSRRGYCLWLISFCVLKPLQLQEVGLFENRLSAVLAARLPNNSTISAIQILFSRSYVSAIPNQRDLVTKAAAVAKADGLNDDFVELKFCWPGHLEYATLHGKRCLDAKDSSQCQFEVTYTGDGFVMAVPLPYTLRPWGGNCQYGILVVHPAPWAVDAREAGYARAVALRYQRVAASGSGDYPDGALIVAIDPCDQEARAAGYADAVPLVFST